MKKTSLRFILYLSIKYDISAYVCLTEFTSTSYRNRDTCETINECVKIHLKLSTVIHLTITQVKSADNSIISMIILTSNGIKNNCSLGLFRQF